MGNKSIPKNPGSEITLSTTVEDCTTVEEVIVENADGSTSTDNNPSNLFSSGKRRFRTGKSVNGRISDLPLIIIGRKHGSTNGNNSTKLPPLNNKREKQSSSERSDFCELSDVESPDCETIVESFFALNRADSEVFGFPSTQEEKSTLLTTPTENPPTCIKKVILAGKLNNIIRQIQQ
jgi:hypothetical protein